MIYRMTTTRLIKERKQKQVEYIPDIAKKNEYIRGITVLRIQKKDAPNFQTTTFNIPQKWVKLTCSQFTILIRRR